MKMEKYIQIKVIRHSLLIIENEGEWHENCLAFQCV